MSAAALVERLTAAGVALALEGDRVRYRGPREVLTPEVLAELHQHKCELVAVLRGKPAAPLVPREAKAALAARFVALEALIPAAVVADPARWAQWRRLDTCLNGALAAGDLAGAEAVLAEAERWAQAVSTKAPARPAEVSVPASCPSCGGVREPILYQVLGRPAVRCSACGDWELIGGTP